MTAGRLDMSIFKKPGNHTGRGAAAKDKIIETVLGGVSPIGDVRSSKEYRVAMLKYFTEKMLDAFVSGEEVRL